MKKTAIALGLVIAVTVAVFSWERLAERPSASNPPAIVEKEHYDADGRRLAPVFVRGPKVRRSTVDEEVRVYVRPDYVEVGEYRVEHQSVALLANRALKESGKNDVAVFAAEETPYFQVVQVLDGLRRSDAKIVWLITGEAIQPSETTRGK
jgi:hypothetical protein